MANEVINYCTTAANVSTADGSDVETELGRRSLTGHTHTKSEITNFPSSLKNPNSLTVQLNGGSTEGTNKFTYDGSAAKSMNITPSSVGAAASSHTHTKSQITDFPSSLKNPSSLTVQLNGGSTEGTNKFTYDGSAAKSIDITPVGIGASAEGHTHTKSEITDFPSSLKNPSALTVNINGTTVATYDGSSTKTINITLASLGLSYGNTLPDPSTANEGDMFVLIGS